VPPIAAKQRRPKRKQVKRACSNCRKSHSGCNDLRPCSRCVENGLEATCADVPRKKRATRRKPPTDVSRYVDLGSLLHQERIYHPELARSSKTAMDEVASLINFNVAAATRSRIGHCTESPMAVDSMGGAQPAISTHPLRLKIEPSSADLHNHLLNSSLFIHSGGGARSSSRPSSTSEIASSMNKANNYQFLVTELTDLRRYNTKLEHTLQDILAEVQQLRCRNDGASAKTEASSDLSSSSSAAHANPHSEMDATGGDSNQSLGSQLAGIATWLVHDSTMLECNDRFMEIVQHPFEVLKSNFKCLQLFPQRLYKDFIAFKKSLLYGGGNSSSSKKMNILLPNGEEKSVMMTLQALKQEENMQPQFMVMHIEETDSLEESEQADFLSGNTTDIGEKRLSLPLESMDCYSLPPSRPPNTSLSCTPPGFNSNRSSNNKSLSLPMALHIRDT